MKILPAPGKSRFCPARGIYLVGESEHGWGWLERVAPFLFLPAPEIPIFAHAQYFTHVAQGLGGAPQGSGAGSDSSRPITTVDPSKVTSGTSAKSKNCIEEPMTHKQQPSLPEVGSDFEESVLPPNGAASNADLKAAAPKPLFGGVSARTAAAAKKGNTSTSRTGKAKQATFSFGKPKKSVFVKVHPSPAYTMTNVPVYQNDIADTFHFIQPDLYESGELPERFVRAVKLIDLFVAGAADGSFFIWFVPVTSHVSRKGALKAVEAARGRYVLVEWFRQASTYTIEPATEAIPEPKWETLPSLESMMLDAFDSVVSVADDKVVRDYMSGGVANRRDEEDEE